MLDSVFDMTINNSRFIMLKMTCVQYTHFLPLNHAGTWYYNTSGNLNTLCLISQNMLHHKGRLLAMASRHVGSSSRPSLRGPVVDEDTMRPAGDFPSVLWRCWLGGRKSTRTVKKQWWGASVVFCLKRGADLHTAQLMPLPLTVSCFSKFQIAFTSLVLAHPGSPEQRVVKRVCVCVFIVFMSVHWVTLQHFQYYWLACSHLPTNIRNTDLQT